MISIQKKIFIVLFGILLSSVTVFSESVTVWVMPTECGKNLNKAEARWLPGEVHKKLRENITNYSKFTVAEENSEEFAKIQTKSYNENISEKDKIRMGKQIGADYVVCSSITIIESSYRLNIFFQNLESGVYLAEINKSAETQETLYMNYGSAVDEAFIELCDILDQKFKTSLSYADKQRLRYGPYDLSRAEDRLHYEEKKKKNENDLNKINDKLQSKSLSTESYVELMKIQEELKKRQELLNQDLLRFQQEEKDRVAEQEDQKSRTPELQKTIDNELKILRGIAEETRKQKFESSSIIAQINQIEAKKKALVEMRNERNAKIKKISEEEKIQISKKQKEIMEAPLLVTQINSKTGDMLPEVRKAREKQFHKEEESIRKEYQPLLSKTQTNYIEAEKELLKQIKEDNSKLAKVYEADNIGNRKLELYVNRYQAEKKAWRATVSLIIDEENLFQKEFDISYQALTKSTEEPDFFDEKYKETVDMYNSLFSLGAQPVTAKITYKISAAPANKPSQYNIHVYNIVFIDTKTGTKIESSLINGDYPYQRTPVYDIRDKIKTYGEIQRNEKVENSEYLQLFNQHSEKGVLASKSGAGFGFGLLFDGAAGADVFLNVPLGKYVFLESNGDFRYDSGELSFVYVGAGVGFNKRLLFGWPPNLFVCAGIGLIQSHETDKAAFKFKIGVDIPLYSPVVSITSYASVYTTFDQVYGSITAGIILSPGKFLNENIRNGWKKYWKEFGEAIWNNK